MTSVPTPDQGPPGSSVDLSQLVDDLEERVDTRDHRPEREQDDQRQDITSDVPGTPEPPD